MRYFLPMINPTLWMEISAIVFLILFSWLLVWTYLPSRRATYDHYGELPLSED